MTINRSLISTTNTKIYFYFILISLVICSCSDENSSIDYPIHFEYKTSGIKEEKMFTRENDDVINIELQGYLLQTQSQLNTPIDLNEMDEFPGPRTFKLLSNDELEMVISDGEELITITVPYEQDGLILMETPYYLTLSPDYKTITLYLEMSHHLYWSNLSNTYVNNQFSGIRSHNTLEEWKNELIIDQDYIPSNGDSLGLFFFGLEYSKN